LKKKTVVGSQLKGGVKKDIDRIIYSDPGKQAHGKKDPMRGSIEAGFLKIKIQEVTIDRSQLRYFPSKLGIGFPYGHRWYAEPEYRS
jgi:hypothetical protein